MKKKTKTIRKGITPEIAEDSLSFLDTIAPVFDGIPAEDWEAYCLPILAELFVEELKEGIPALADGIPDHLDEMLKPGSLAWSLWEAQNPRFSSWYREAALKEIKKKLYHPEGKRPHDPLHWLRKKGKTPRVEKTLRDEHPELTPHAALELRVIQALCHASEKVLSLLPKKPMDAEKVFWRLKNTMSDNAIPREILGEDWEKRLPEEDCFPVEEDFPDPSFNVLDPHHLGEKDVDSLFDTLAKLGKLTKMERNVFNRVRKNQETDNEVAEILGISKTAVRQRLLKARKKLMEALSKI